MFTFVAVKQQSALFWFGLFACVCVCLNKFRFSVHVTLTTSCIFKYRHSLVDLTEVRPNIKINRPPPPPPLFFFSGRERGGLLGRGGGGRGQQQTTTVDVTPDVIMSDRGSLTEP